jgi:hypothetical protein
MRIPERFIEDPDFLEEVLEGMEDYGSDMNPMAHLAKFKERAWDVSKEWRKKSKFESFDWLWEVQQLNRKLRAVHAFPDPKKGLSNLEERVLEEVRVRSKKEAPTQWRKKFLLRARGVLREWIASLEAQCEIPRVDEKWKLRKIRGCAKVKGLMKDDGEILRVDSEVREGITKFWGDLFGGVREFKEEKLDELCGIYPRRFAKEKRHVMDPKEVMKLLIRKNLTNCGPDGIPFGLYAKMAGALLGMWVDLIQEAGEEGEWEDKFCEA